MAAARQVVLPDTFSGRSHDDFQIWVAQFNVAAQVNQWSNRTKLQMLTLRLKGPALRAFHAIPEAERNIFERAIEALQNRFSPVERQSVHRAALRARRRRPDEDLSELADDILLLVGRAYPGMGAEALDSLALEAFLDAIDPSLRRRVRDNDPGTLNNALSRALVLDAYDEADRRSGSSQRSSRHVNVAAASVEAEPHARQSSPSDAVLRDLLNTQQQILQSLERLSIQQQAPRAQHTHLLSRPVICYHCGEEGHMRPACPRLPPRPSSAPQQSRQTQPNGRSSQRAPLNRR